MSPTSEHATITALQQGQISMQGEFMWGSNYTYLSKLAYDTQELLVVYKPTKGVRPLWDFPSASLARREVAAYLVSEALGWKLVPPTSYRRDAPLGPGSIQLFIDHDPENHYFNFTSEERQRLRPTVLFDVIINNADRKGSHVMLDPNRHLWLIDHGICFHSEDKLRTVIWDFAGEPIPEKLLSDVGRLIQKLEPSEEPVEDPDAPSLWRELGHYLNHTEVLAIRRRLERVLELGCFPNPDSNRRQYPWPPV